MKRLFQLFTLIFTVTLGAVYALLFAKKPGKKLRSELSKSKNPLKDLFGELVDIDKEALKSAKEYVENSEDLQNVMKGGKEQFDAFVKGMKEMGGDAAKTAEIELKKIEKNAKIAAEQLKKKAGKKMAVAKKRATKKVATVKKTVAKRLKK